VIAQVGDLLFAAEDKIPDGGDDFNVRGKHLESEIETNLVVSCPGASVGHIPGTDLPGIFDDGDGLENPF